MIEPRARSIVARIASAVISWGACSAVCALAFAIPVIDRVTLGPSFMNSILFASVLALVPGAFIAFLLGRCKRTPPKPSKEWPFNRKQTLILVISVSLLLGIVSMLSTWALQSREDGNAAKAEEARTRFVVVSYTGTGPGFSSEAVNQTLAELEDSFQKLKDNWEFPEMADRISVWLFRDLQDYQAATGAQDAAGHAYCTAEHGAVIVVPLEKAPSSAIEVDSSRTPTHEMVHALMCQSLGSEAFYSIPRWFHEGLAEQYAMEGLARIIPRVKKRVALWFNRENLMETDRFCALRLKTIDIVEFLLFYETAREFVNSLEARYNERSLNLVVGDVRTGLTFDESMQTRFGGTCNELYSRWKDGL